MRIYHTKYFIYETRSEKSPPTYLRLGRSVKILPTGFDARSATHATGGRGPQTERASEAVADYICAAPCNIWIA